MILNNFSFLRILIFLLVSVLLFSCNDTEITKPIAKKGMIDLSQYNFNDEGIIELNGEWEFYWDQLLTPDDFLNNNITEQQEFITMPDYWMEKEVNGKTIGANGFCTVRLLIKGDFDDEKLMLNVKEIMSNCIVYLNGEIVGSYGKVGTTEDESVSDYSQLHIPIKLDGPEHEIIIQASNYHHRLGGFFDPVTIGPYYESQKSFVFNISFDFFLFSSLLIMALYHFGLFIFRRKEKAPLYFGIFALMISIRMLFTNEQSLTFFIPGINWDLLYNFEYITQYIAMPAFLLFFREVFPKEMPKIFVRIIFIISSLFILVTLLIPTAFASVIMTYYHILIVVGVGFSLYGIIAALIRKREAAWILMAGIVFVILGVMNDMLHNHSIINSYEVSGIAMFIFILCQSFVLSSRFTKTFNENEQLSKRLEYQNINLERIVDERTIQISQQKEEIQSQRDELFTKNEDLELKNSQILDSIAYAKAIQSAILPSIDLIQKHIPESFVYFKPRDIVSGDFYWFTEIGQELYIAAIDCTGHGVPGAFMSMIGNTSLNQIIIHERVTDTNNILMRLNQEVIFAFQKGQHDSDQDDGMEITLCKISKPNQKITISSANQSFMYAEPDGDEVITVKGDVLSIAGRYAPKENQNFTVHEIDYQAGTQIYLFSDGFADQFGGPQKRKFFNVGIKKMLEKVKQYPLSQQKEIIEETFLDWKGMESQTDDVLMIGIKID
jgi:serine phosphatase RsbU (regulator of sigma subunit)